MSVQPQETQGGAVDDKPTSPPAVAGCALSSPSMSALYSASSATQAATMPWTMDKAKAPLPTILHASLTLAAIPMLLCMQAVMFGHTSSRVLLGTH